MLESQDARTDQGLLMDQVGRAPSKPILQLGTEAQSLPFLLRQQEQESHMLRTLQRQKKLRKTLSCRAVVDLGAGGAGKSGEGWPSTRAYTSGWTEPSNALLAAACGAASI